MLWEKKPGLQAKASELKVLSRIFERNSEQVFDSCETKQNPCFKMKICDKKVFIDVLSANPEVIV
jgi:hypothetical protein